MCFLFDIMGSCLPHTETEIYTEFTKHTLLRTLTRIGVDSLNSLESLPSNAKKIFHQICMLGFEKTIASKQVMKKSELDLFMDVASGNESLGLITVDRMASKCGYDYLYTFLHLTFQEYLAAYRISKLAEDEQLKLISKYGKSKCMYVVWKFFCGLVEFQESNVHIFDHILASMSKSLKGDLYSVQCAFESQQAISCDSVVRFGECGTLSFIDVSTPSDFAAIVYVLKNTAALVKKVVFDKCDFGSQGTIFEGLKLCLKLKTLTLSQHYGYWFSRTFVGRNNSSNWNDDCARAIADCLKHWPDLQILNLEKSGIGVDGTRAIADCLKHCPNLQTLNLGWNSIGDDGAWVIADGLKHCPNLQTLNLRQISINNYGARVIADGLKYCPNLQTLDLWENSIGVYGARAVADGLKNCPNLQTLNLGWNSIGGDGARAIADGLKHYPNLQTLDLGSNSIGDDCAKALADGLKHCPNLQILDLRGNSIGDDGARTIGNGLKDCPNLQRLNLGGNRIGINGARTIADCLKHCPDLMELNLKFNLITDFCKKSLAKYLEHHPNLKLSC